jgi:hypothetical protein
MISRRQGGGDEAYFTYVEEADSAANKDSALIGSAFPEGKRMINKILHYREFPPVWRKLPFKIGI